MSFCRQEGYGRTLGFLSANPCSTLCGDGGRSQALRLQFWNTRSTKLLAAAPRSYPRAPSSPDAAPAVSYLQRDQRSSNERKNLGVNAKPDRFHPKPGTLYHCESRQQCALAVWTSTSVRVQTHRHRS